jgi:2-methylisocitrate lyase-like PEP mutase family enzyme
MTEEIRECPQTTPQHSTSCMKNLLILPNAWDAASARIVQDAGAKAIATSSAAVAWAQGYADGHHFPVANLVGVVAATARAVSIPITCDAEGGYSDDPKEAAENVAKLIDAGAVGINLEDGKQPHELHLKKIEAIRAAAEKKGVNLFINARTDVVLKALVPPEQAVEETLRRAAAIEQAGGSGPLCARHRARARKISADRCSGTKLPLNIMARPECAGRDAIARARRAPPQRRDRSLQCRHGRCARSCGRFPPRRRFRRPVATPRQPARLQQALCRVTSSRGAPR